MLHHTATLKFLTLVLVPTGTFRARFLYCGSRPERSSRQPRSCRKSAGSAARSSCSPSPGTPTAPPTQVPHGGPQSCEPVTALVSAVIPAHSCEFELNNSECDSTAICTVVLANIAGELLTAHVSGEWLAGIWRDTCTVGSDY